MSKIGTIDLFPFDYMISYKQNGELNTRTLPEESFQINYIQMKKDKTVEIISVYKRLSSEEILDKVIE
jgi:SH3-like domain-containing protein